MKDKVAHHYAATADRRSEIAVAARALIAEQGFEGLRTRDIASRVGINIATLHYHVPTKAALVQLVAESLRDDFIAQHRSRPRQGLTARRRLELELEEFDEANRENPQLHLVYGELLARARRDPVVAEIMQPMLDYWYRQLVAILADGVTDGSFRPDIDPEAAAGIVIGAVTWRSRNAAAPVADIRKLAAELLRSFEFRKPDTPDRKQKP